MAYYSLREHVLSDNITVCVQILKDKIAIASCFNIEDAELVINALHLHQEHEQEKARTLELMDQVSNEEKTHNFEFMAQMGKLVKEF